MSKGFKPMLFDEKEGRYFINNQWIFIDSESQVFLSTFSNENNPNLSQVQEKVQSVRQQGAGSKGRSNYLNCYHCGSVLAAGPIARRAILAVIMA